MRIKSLAVTLLGGLALVAIQDAVQDAVQGTGNAWAQGASTRRASNDAHRREDIQERIKSILAKLTSKERSDVRAGYEAMGDFGPDAAAAVPTANRVLSNGLPIDLATTALRALGKVRQESSSRAIRIYLRHRHAPLRREAVKALVHTGGAQAKDGLRSVLSDSDARVRGLAATGLGELHAVEHIDALFSALDHKVPEAAASIGQLCNPEQCERFAQRTGRVGFDVMTSGFDQILFRNAEQMPDEEKTRIIGRIRELGTGEAHQFLEDVQGRWPEDGSKRVKKVLDLAVQSTQGSPGAGAS